MDRKSETLKQNRKILVQRVLCPMEGAVFHKSVLIPVIGVTSIIGTFYMKGSDNCIDRIIL